MDKEMRDRKTHFNKTVEKIRSTLIQSIPKMLVCIYILLLKPHSHNWQP